MKPYYVMPIIKDNKIVKTHLCYIGDGNLVYQFCLRNIPVMIHDLGCICSEKCDCEGVEADEEWVKYWDLFCHEVTCPTCLRKAKGEESNNAQLELPEGIL